MLKIQDLHVYYGGIEAVQGVSLEIPRGSIVTLVGANGAGKSSIIRSIAGLNKSISGDILLTRREGESWTEFTQTYFDRFLQDRYGDCQQELMDRFEQNFTQQGE